MLKNIRSYWNLRPGTKNKPEVHQQIVDNIRFTGPLLWILMGAILIACIGLTINSSAVVIGAMLISPLMGPIVGAAYALATKDLQMIKTSCQHLVLASVVSIAVSFLFFYLSPFKQLSPEILLRTTPTIFDVLIGFIGGFIGAIALTRAHQTMPYIGVVIATALMPPLCSAGYGLARADYPIFLSALYLYSINCFYICLGFYSVLKYLNYPMAPPSKARVSKALQTMMSIIVVCLAIPSLFLGYKLLKEKELGDQIDAFINTEFTLKGYAVQYKNTQGTPKNNTLQLAFVNADFDALQWREFQQKLPQYSLNNTTLILIKSTNQQTVEKNPDQGDLLRQINLLFPQLDQVYFGSLTHYNQQGTLEVTQVLFYNTQSPFDIQKLQRWLNMVTNQNVRIIPVENP